MEFLLTGILCLLILQVTILVAGLIYLRRKLKQQEQRFDAWKLKWQENFKENRQQTRQLRRRVVATEKTAGRIAEAISRSPCLFDDLYDWLQLWRIRKAPHRHLHVVYGCPKCGNSTLRATLWENPAIGDTAMSSHFLAPDTFRHRARFITRAGRHTSKEVERQTAVREALAAFGFLDGNPAAGPGAPLHVITPVREPVAAALSFLAFKNFHRLESNSQRPQLDFFDDAWEFSAARELADEASPDPLLLQPEWFRLEFAKVFGFNPVDLPFDPAEGFLIHEFPHIRFLFLRVEDFGRLTSILARFYEVPEAKLEVVSINRAKDRADKEHYRREIANFKLPRQRLRELYDTPFCRTFYSEEERNAFLEKWSD